MYIRLIDNVVTDIMEKLDETLYHPDFLAQYREIPNSKSNGKIRKGWVYDESTGKYAEPEPESDSAEEQQKTAELKAAEDIFFERYVKPRLIDEALQAMSADTASADAENTADVDATRIRRMKASI